MARTGARRDDGVRSRSLLWWSASPALGDDAHDVPAGEYDPFVRGRFPVGVRTFYALDRARNRRFPCELWYPAPAQHAGQDPAPALWDVFPVASRHARQSQCAVRDAAAAPGAWPLILFSHSSGGQRRSATFLCTHLSSHGYVVAALDHSEVVAPELARWSNGLRVGYWGTVRWWRGERETGSIGYCVLSLGVILLRYRQQGEDVQYNVAITYTTLASGGERPWWLCPTCGRRCGVIYGCWLGGRYFVCRICGDLAYASQHTRHRKNADMWEYLAGTGFGRRLLAEMEAERAVQLAAQRAVVREVVGGPRKLPRGRPRTKRPYRRRSLVEEPGG
jgi:hypothetical protein